MRSPTAAPRELNRPPRCGFRAYRPRRRAPAPTRLGWAFLFALLLLLGGVSAAIVRADDEETPRYVPASRGPRASYQTDQVQQWRELVSQYDWDVETALLVISCESEGNPLARNPHSDAKGLWQLLGWEHLAYRLHGVWSVMNPYVATDLAYRIWEWGGRRFDTAIGWHASVGCWGW